MQLRRTPIAIPKGRVTSVPRPRPAVLDLAAEHSVTGMVLGCALLAVAIPCLQFLHGASGPLGPSIPLVFLVPVLLASGVGGRLPGVVIAIIALFAWDWFFIKPYYTVTVYYPRDVAALAVFLAVALLTGQLATTARRRAAEVLQRAEGAEALYRLSTALLTRQEPSTVLRELTARLRDTFGLRSCAVLLFDRATETWKTEATAGTLAHEQSVEENRSINGMVNWVARNGEMTELPSQHVQFLPLQVGSNHVGVLQLVFRQSGGVSDESRRLILTFANGAALALERARLAEEERLAEVARESDRLKSALLSSVSHDLRTPLAGIKAAASSLLQGDIEWSDEDRRAFLEDIDGEADRLAHFVSNLLDLSRIEAGAITPRKEWEDIGELVERVVRRMRVNIPAHPLHAQIDAHLPIVLVDPVHVEQALTNLLENAARYSGDGKPIIVAATLSTPDQTELCVSVADEGTGIPNDEQEKIFDKFYQVAGSGRHTGGTGMGLAIVQGLVKAGGGHVTVRSAPGEGSTFTIHLPVDEDRARVPLPLASKSIGGLP